MILSDLAKYFGDTNHRAVCPRQVSFLQCCLLFFFQIYLIERYITARVPERFNFTFLCFFSLIVYVLLFHRCSCPAAGRSLTVSPCCSCICISNTVPVKGLIYSRIYAHVVLVDGPKWHIRHSCCSWLDSRYCCYF